MRQDVAFSKCSPSMFGKAVTEHGYIILRSAISKQKVTRFKRELEPIIADYMELTADTIKDRNWQRWWPGNPVSFALDLAQAGYINDEMVKDASQETVSMYDLISDPRFYALLEGGFPNQIFRATPVAHCRRMTKKIDPRAFVPLHCDIRYHQDGLFALNFWTPLDPAGDAFGTAGIEVWPVGFRTMRDFVGEDFSDGAAIDQHMQDVPTTFGASERTNIDTGDVLVFNSWTPHRTSVPDQAKADRLSVEVRLATDHFPDRLPQPPFVQRFVDLWRQR